MYHEYCLGFKVSTDPNVKWTCPRHLCMACADKKVVYFCRYTSGLPIEAPPTIEVDVPGAIADGFTSWLLG